MSLRRALAVAVAVKELRHIIRDPRTLFLVTASPALTLFTFADVFSFDGTSIFSPIRHYMIILRTIMLEGANLTTLWPEALALTALGVGMAFLSMRNVARAFE